MTTPDFLTAECPCDGCPNRLRCSDQRLACAQFSMFMADEPAKRWRLAPRQPTREIYAATLGKPAPQKWRKRPGKSGQTGKQAAARFNVTRSQRARVLPAVDAAAPDASAAMALLKGEMF
jgi:hypothetical protein